MRTPKLRQLDMVPLQRVVQQSWTTASPSRSFDGRQGYGRRTEAPAFDEICRRKVAASKSGTQPMYASALAGDGYLDDIGCEHRQPEPPRCRQAAGGRAMPVSPHCGANPCRVGELAVVREEDTGCAAYPAAHSNPSINRVRA
jgi:hypothetical protein